MSSLNNSKKMCLGHHFCSSRCGWSIWSFVCCTKKKKKKWTNGNLAWFYFSLSLSLWKDLNGHKKPNPSNQDKLLSQHVHVKDGELLWLYLKVFFFVLMPLKNIFERDWDFCHLEIKWQPLCSFRERERNKVLSSAKKQCASLMLLNKIRKIHMTTK